MTNDKLAKDPAPSAFFTSPQPAGAVGGRAEIAVTVPEGGFNQVTFAYRPVGTTAWKPLGTDDNAPYRVFHDVSGLSHGGYPEYRAIVRDHDGDLAVANSHGFVGTPPPPAAGGGGGSVSPVPQPPTVSVPGSHGSEMGCTPALATAGGDWEPGCDAAQLALRSDGLWSRTYSLPTKQYEYKVAINRTWDENYGQRGERNGSNIVYDHAGGPVTFFHDHRTNDAVPAANVTFTVPKAGDVVRFTLDPAAGSLGVTIEPPPVVPDLSTERATWTAADTVVLDVPTADRRGWSYRLRFGPAGSLALDQETVGGSSVPLALDPTSPASAERLLLDQKTAKDAAGIARSGQLAVVVVYDAAGRVVDATGVTVGTWASAATGGKGKR